MLGLHLFMQKAVHSKSRTVQAWRPPTRSWCCCCCCYCGIMRLASTLFTLAFACTNTRKLMNVLIVAYRYAVTCLLTWMTVK